MCALSLRSGGGFHDILSFVGAGDHLLITGSAYEPTQDFCTHILGRMKVATTYFDPLIGVGITELIQPNTHVVFLEYPGSITMEVQDIPAMVQAIRACGTGGGNYDQ